MALLIIEVEFLTGVSVAASPYTRDEAEWPPHPDRLFQALVAAWGRNVPPIDDERSALEWLETLDPDALTVLAPKAFPRDVAVVYVPPNDAKTSGKSLNKVPKNLADTLTVIPELRKNRQPRSFPAVLPAAEHPLVRYVWRLNEQEEQEFAVHRLHLVRLAKEVTYLGHSHSLVRVALTDSLEGSKSGNLDWSATPITLRFPHRGRLRYLREQYERALAENRSVRPKPSLVTRRFELPQTPVVPSTVFDSDNVTVFSAAGGFTPALSAFPLVAKRLRDALLKCVPQDITIPTLLSGRTSNGFPMEGPHIAIVPLADVGWPYSQGKLMGLALVWPRRTESDDRRGVLKSVASFLKEDGGKTGLLYFGREGSWSLALEPEPNKASLRSARYSRPSRRWGTILPAILDRHPKDKPGDRLADIIVKACFNIGLPKEAIDGLEVEIHKYGPVKGAPSVDEVLQALPEDSPYRNRPLAHLVLTFPQPIRGPLILGAGRYRGLGLCLPLDEEARDDGA